MGRREARVKGMGQGEVGNELGVRVARGQAGRDETGTGGKVRER